MQGIILAAGLGSRMGEATKTTPKSLFKVDGTPVLERNIECMIEAGFEKVVLVTGYMREKFAYLKSRYENRIDIEILFNREYDSSNTVSSLYAARQHLDRESYITTADIYLLSNPFLKYSGDYCFYLLRPYSSFPKEEWVGVLDQKRRFIAVNTRAHEGYPYSGISHWTIEGLSYLRAKLDSVDWTDEKQRAQYWDELLLNDLDEFPLFAQILSDNREVYEFDDMGDVRLFEKSEHKSVTIC